ncbi:MAG: Omp28-related outer membrane protein [Flavobacteriales bacterium]|nr:Omp28-related outer membrane protein [Flavobacteriales bacterium]
MAEIINTPAEVEVIFDTVSYNTGTNTVSMTLKVVPVVALTGDHNLTIYLTEDSVVDAQIDNRVSPPNVLDYLHRHVLRGNVNSTWGETVVTGSAAAGDTLTVTHDYVLPANVLVPAHCGLVAYLYRTDTYEVLQAEEAKIEP